MYIQFPFFAPDTHFGKQISNSPAHNLFDALQFGAGRDKSWGAAGSETTLINVISVGLGAKFQAPKNTEMQSNEGKARHTFTENISRN